LSFATAELAVQNLQYLTNLLVDEIKRIPKGTEGRLRMVVDVRNFPEPLQYLSQYWGDWKQSSDWYDLEVLP